MAATTAALSSRVTFRAAPVRGAKAVSSKATARAAPLRNVTTRASIADLPKENKDCKVLVVGGTGYIGKFVVRELCAQGYDVTAFVRDKSGIGGKTDASGAKSLFPDASVKFGSVGDCDSIRANAFDDTKYDVVVSCLASRTGGIKDSWDIDYQATKNVLDVARENNANALRPPLRHLRPKATSDVPSGEVEIRGGPAGVRGHLAQHRPTHRVLQVTRGAGRVRAERWSVRHVRGRPARVVQANLRARSRQVHGTLKF